MSDIKLTNAKMNTFDSNEKISTFQTASRLVDFGEKQNTANILLATNINELIKRVCFLEDQNIQLTETLRHLADKQIESINKINAEHSNAMKNIAVELKSLKAELDRVRLSTKLNNSAIDRLNNAVSIAENKSN
ncbi:MAG: hypothetical protein NC205_00620 [Prevotella sp.]|nr:hypothetical protein [Alistipes senegalensis]MCM1357066.1 hypothetical protein [Prevotella sp.]MCM1473097.1 hypothetical protein [Muribaculaceae bacterium]